MSVIAGLTVGERVAWGGATEFSSLFTPAEVTRLTKTFAEITLEDGRVIKVGQPAYFGTAARRVPPHGGWPL